MLDRRFQSGDRVRTRVAICGVAVGTPGTVQIQFTAVSDLYQVLFDGELYPNLLRAGEMEAEIGASTPPSR